MVPAWTRRVSGCSDGEWGTAILPATGRSCHPPGNDKTRPELTFKDRAHVRGPLATYFTWLQAGRPNHHEAMLRYGFAPAPSSLRLQPAYYWTEGMKPLSVTTTHCRP